MFSIKAKTIITLSVILTVLPAAINLFAAGENGTVETKEYKMVQQADSLTATIEERISFYQAELKKNSETIQQMEKELEERRRLNERLNGAIAAAQEIKQSLQPGQNNK